MLVPPSCVTRLTLSCANFSYIFTDPTIVNDTTTDQTQLASQFDHLLVGLFPYITTDERQAVAKQYPISEAPSKGNTFSRISAVIADSTFVCVASRPPPESR